MLPDRLETWAPALGRRLESLPAAVGQEMRSQRFAMLAGARRRVRRRSGRLAQSLEVHVSGRTSRVALTLRSNHPGAAIQDQGGTVRSAGRLMPVPIGGHTLHPREIPNAFVKRTRDGRRFVATRQGVGLRIWHRLMDRVHVPGNRYAERAHEAAAKKVPGELLERIHRELT